MKARGRCTLTQLSATMTDRVVFELELLYQVGDAGRTLQHMSPDTIYCFTWWEGTRVHREGILI